MEKRRRAAEASEWVSDTDADGLLSFNNVCETLGIDPERLRDRVRERRAEKQAA